MSYSIDTGAILGDGTASQNGGYSDAFEFTPVESGFVGTIALAVSYVYQSPETGPNDLAIYLMSNGVDGPGAVLGSFDYSGPSGASVESIITVNAASGILLSAGTEYWLGAGPADLLTSLYGWQNNDWEQYTPVYTEYSQKIDNGSWGPAISDALVPAFEITAAPVPEPNLSIVVCGLGLMLIRSYRLFRQRQKPGGN